MRTPPNQPVPPAPSPARIPAWLLAVLLGLVTVVLYWPALHHDFVDYDDPLYVTGNSQVQAGLSWANLQWAATSAVSSNWHPLTMLSHTLDCQLYGLKPWGHHLTSVLLHALDTLLVFLLLRRLTGAVWRSAAVAALFGWHPAHVESVAWVAERKDVLSACFGLLSLYFYARYAQKRTLGPRPSALDYCLTLLCLALGLLSKPMLVTWPCVMLLLDYWPLNRGLGWRRLVREKIPFFALVAATSAVTYLVQQHCGAMAQSESLAWGARAANALVSYARYLGKLFWPSDLAVFYPHPGSWPLPLVLAAGALLAGLSALFAWQRRQRPHLLVGWLWFVGTLVPVIGLVQVGEQAMADRYTYLPSLGLFILVIWGLDELTRPWRNRTAGLLAAGAAVAACGLAATSRQLAYWQDSETLFRHALAVTADNHLAHNNLGTTLYVKGRMAEAITEYQAALRLKPNDTEAHHNLGLAFLNGDRTDEAIAQFRMALQLKPDYVKAHYNLGLTFLSQGRLDEAAGEFQAALRYRPDYAEAHSYLGSIYSKQGRGEDAIGEFQAALRLQPSAPVCNSLGIAFGKQGRADAAIQQFQAAVRLDPNYAEARYNLGTAFAKQGRLDEAAAQLQEALRLKPDYPSARKNLAYVLHLKNPPGTNP
jgi:protein O-mannosyl-transferase